VQSGKSSTCCRIFVSSTERENVLLFVETSYIMATVTVVRYKRRKRLGDDKSPMMYLLKPKAGESKIYSIDSLAQEIESIGSLSVEDVSHVMKSFVRAMKKVLVAGNKVKVDGLGIFYTTLTCPGVEQEKDCTVKNITRINLRFKVDNSLRLANDSTQDVSFRMKDLHGSIVKDTKSMDTAIRESSMIGTEPITITVPQGQLSYFLLQ
jgi:predicted histone-like DNA-binding protein